MCRLLSAAGSHKDCGRGGRDAVLAIAALMLLLLLLLLVVVYASVPRLPLALPCR